MGTLWNRAHVRHRLARMKSSNVLIVVIVAYASTLAVSGQTIVDVRQPINLELIDSFKHFLHSSLMMAPQLAFIDKDRLAVSFLNPCSGPAAEPPPRLKKREEENMPCVLTLTVLLLDYEKRPGRGYADLSVSQFVSRDRLRLLGRALRLLMPNRAGEFVIHTGDFLQRYGNTQAEIHRIEPLPETRSRSWTARVLLKTVYAQQRCRAGGADLWSKT
jgi:hypothetical protein